MQARGSDKAATSKRFFTGESSGMQNDAAEMAGKDDLENGCLEIAPRYLTEVTSPFIVINEEQKCGTNC